MSENPGGPPPRDDDAGAAAPGAGEGGAYPPSPQTPPGAGGAYPPPPSVGQGAPVPPTPGASGTPSGPGAGGYPPPAQPYGQGAPGGYGAPGAGAYGQAGGGQYGQPGPGGYGQSPYGQGPHGQTPYGQTPYGQTPYGQPYAGGSGSGIDVGAGFSWAFTKFGQNWVALVVGGLAWAVGIFVVVLVAYLVFGGLGALAGGDRNAGPGLAIGFGIGGVVIGALSVLLGALWVAAYVRAALRIADGRTITVADMFDLSQAGQVFLVGLLVAVAYLVANLTWIFAPLVMLAVVYFVYFAWHFVLDKGQGAIDALRSSVQLQVRDVGTSILVVLLAWVVSAVGVAVCGVGALVGTPVAVLLSVYAFRRLTGGPLAA
ncbi:hypothetical protein [Cellulomonas sp.]|uniref:DUF3824 domain-containing protein n=1 Tax=Cellulomonas sp. TaxID=40001 RepID=UPI0028119A1D|nr:hypothetical protein [Cellulomonas sp.]